jgi:formylmethanofuran dehydrogenase subunit E
MAQKFPEAHKRMFANIFVCKKCKTKQRSTMQKVLEGKILCKSCGGKAFRTLRKAK